MLMVLLAGLTTIVLIWVVGQRGEDVALDFTPADAGSGKQDGVSVVLAEHGDDESEEHAEHEGEGEPSHEEGEGEEHAVDKGEENPPHDHSKHVFPTETQQVVMVGRIGGLANPSPEMQPDFPFAKGRAIVFLADLGAVAENEVEGHNHAPGEECAFCASHAANTADMLAFVRFLDEKGEVLPMDVQQLFDVNGKETVVVRGSARIVAGGTLVVDATAIYIRR